MISSNALTIVVVSKMIYLKIIFYQKLTSSDHVDCIQSKAIERFKMLCQTWSLVSGETFLHPYKIYNTAIQICSYSLREDILNFMRNNAWKDFIVILRQNRFYSQKRSDTLILVNV